jgi:GNAT superfamily N-acetyltransferase
MLFTLFDRKEGISVIALVHNHMGVDTYLDLRESVGFKPLSRRQAKIALDASLFVVCAFIGDKIVGMGRIVGDGAVICYIQDLMIHPDYQGQGVGSAIIEELIAFVKDLAEDGEEIMLDLMCAKGREPFYHHHGFISRPTDGLGPGMICYIKG